MTPPSFSFETAMNSLPESHRVPIRVVTDTVSIAHAWLDARGQDYTVADVLTLTGLILAREGGTGGWMGT